jgi:hypothetical protein
MLLPVSTVEQIRALRAKYESDTAVVIAAVDRLTNTTELEVVA